MDILSLLAPLKMDISHLPYHLTVQIVKKTDIRARCRLYRANSSMKKCIDTSNALNIKNLELYKDFLKFLVGFHKLLDEAGHHLLKGNDFDEEIHDEIDRIGQRIAEVAMELHELLPLELQRRLRLLLTLRQFCDFHCDAYKRMEQFIKSREGREQGIDRFY